MTVKKVVNDEMKKAAFDIRLEVFVKEKNVPFEKEIDEWDDKSDVAMFIDYDSDGNPLATGRFRQVGNYGKIERICTYKFARGTGCGRRIIEAIEKEAKRKQIPLLKLNAQLPAIPFYEKLGYHITSDVFLDAGIEHKEMTKEL